MSSKVIRKYCILVSTEKSSKERSRQECITLKSPVVVNDGLSAREAGPSKSKC